MNDFERNRLRPLDFEIRARQFIHHVRGIQMKMTREHHSIELTAEDALAKWSDRFSAFATVVKRYPNWKNINNSRADELDRQTVDHSIVEILAYSDLRSSLKIFVNEVYDVAKKMGAQSTPELIELLVTTDEPDEIVLIGEGAASMKVFHKTFKFE